MSTQSSDQVRPDALTLMNVIQVDITWTLSTPSGEASNT